jgi:hypothetical protein
VVVVCCACSRETGRWWCVVDAVGGDVLCMLTREAGLWRHHVDMVTWQTPCDLSAHEVRPVDTSGHMSWRQ